MCYLQYRAHANGLVTPIPVQAARGPIHLGVRLSTKEVQPTCQTRQHQDYNVKQLLSRSSTGGCAKSEARGSEGDRNIEENTSHHRPQGLRVKTENRAQRLVSARQSLTNLCKNKSVRFTVRERVRHGGALVRVGCQFKPC